DGIDFFTLSWGGDLAIVGASVGGSEQSQLFLVDTRTGRRRQLTNKPEARYGMVVWAKDDRSIYYRSNEKNGRDFYIYHMNLADGKTEEIFGNDSTLDGSKWIANMSQDGTKLIISRALSNTDNELWLLDLPSGQYTALTKDSGDVLYEAPVLMPDNKNILLLCNDNPEGRLRLAWMEVGSPDVHFVNDGWIDPRWEIDDMVVSRDYRYITVRVNENGYARLKAREIESKLELPSPPLDGMLSGGYFDSSGTCVFTYSGPTQAPDVWRWNPADSELTQLTFTSYAGIDRTTFIMPKLVSFRSFDSLEIPAFLYLPPGYEEGTPVPFLVYAHGGPESQFRPGFYRNFQYFLLNGYGILAVNPRGSSGYGKTYRDLDNYKNRKHSLMDYKAAVDWLIANGYTRHGMIGIRGGSYGGYVVLGMITEYPDLFAAAADAVGIANFKTFLENTKPYRRYLREAEYGPLSDSAFLMEISPITKADRIKTPLLVIHGENDPRVPVEEARQIIKAIRDNGGVVDSLIFPDEGHGVAKRGNIIVRYRKEAAFFDRYLKKPQ
ncbi:MAG: S9 family peptidase, partial [Candidatus Zixiibacteriota bacterium]